VTRSKDIGTRAETAVVNLARELAYGQAERLALRGSEDCGDVRLMLNPLIILEVKAGKAAQHASWEQIKDWLKETARERNNAWKSSSDKTVEFHGFLVTQRRGYGIGRVADWCLWTLPDDRIGEIDFELPPGMFPLGEFLITMRDHWRKSDDV
jgi:hypothetical protein